jgi:putative tryptophan/tyrosine transport system substrate-binding protein
MMLRREFITLLGSAAAAWPLAARGQQPLPVIGVLGSGSRETSDFALAAFAQGLRQQGYLEDRNVSIQYSWADGHYDLLPSMAAEFVRGRVTVIAAFGGTLTAQAANAATSTIPIVFAIGTDPVAMGLVASLNRPGGNLTGATNLTVELAPKRLEMLHDLLPRVTRIGYLTNPESGTALQAAIHEERTAAARLGIEVQDLPVASDAGFGVAFERLVQAGIGALDVTTDPFHLSRRERIVALAMRHRIPTIYSGSEYARAGGLMSYGPSSAALYAIAGDYAGRILKGEKPADLPVQEATKVELIINMKTAEAFGIDVTPALLLRADEVIE